MKFIYSPAGKAREYSPLALNIYDGCDHKCRYCYIPFIPGNRKKDICFPRSFPGLEKEVKNITQQVLLCFIGDPYCRAELKYKATQKVLSAFLGHQVPTAILSKGGKRCLRDLDLFMLFDNIKIGATLTFLDKKDSLYWEPYSALPEERMETLRILHREGIRTWVSLEPVIDPFQTLRIIDETHEFVDQYKVGKLNHLSSKIDWCNFGEQAVKKLNFYGKKFYVKKDLLKYIPGLVTGQQKDQDYMALKKAQYCFGCGKAISTSLRGKKALCADCFVSQPSQSPDTQLNLF